MRALALLLLLLVAGCDKPRAAPQAARSDFLRRIDARPLPDLATLPARVRDRAEGSFEDIVKLREAGGPDAVPALVEILRAQGGKTTTFSLVSAQALFRIGGDEAEAAVRDAFAADESWWWAAADSTFGHEMAAADRDRFLARYALKSTSTTIAARLAADRASVRAGEDVTFTLSLLNASTAAVALVRPRGSGIEADLILRDADGHYVRASPIGTTCGDPKHEWTTLEPKVAREFRFVCSFVPWKPGTPRPEGRYRNHMRHVETASGKGGRFEVIGIFWRAGVPGFGPEPPAKPWTGRVVCEPVPLTIGE